MLPEQVINILLGLLGLLLTAFALVCGFVWWLIKQSMDAKDAELRAVNALIESKESRIQELLHKISELEKKTPEAMIKRLDEVTSAAERGQAANNARVADLEKELARKGADHDKARKEIAALKLQNQQLSLGSDVADLQRLVLRSGASGFFEVRLPQIREGEAVSVADVVRMASGTAGAVTVVEPLNDLERQSKRLLETIKELKEAREEEAHESEAYEAMRKEEKQAYLESQDAARQENEPDQDSDDEK